MTPSGEYEDATANTASESKQAPVVFTAEASASKGAEAPMEVDNHDEEARRGGDTEMQHIARLDDQIAVGPGSCVMEGGRLDFS